MGVHETSPWAVQQDVPVGPQVYWTLRNRIIRAELEPGAHVSEAGLAAAFSLSRQPVREALIKLADNGLVEIRPQRGTHVRKINIGSVMDVRFVREAVEADIVRLVAQAGDPAVIADLRQQIDDQRGVMKLHPEKFMLLDEKFHRTLAAAAGKAYVFRVVDNVKAQMDRVRFLTLMNVSVIETSIRQHVDIVDSIERGDAGDADRALRVHLRQILHDLPAVARLRPEFFDDAEAMQADQESSSGGNL